MAERAVTSDALAVRRRQRDRLQPARPADPRLFRTAFALCGSRAVAEDLVRRTLAQAPRRDVTAQVRVMLRERASIRGRAELEWVADEQADPALARDVGLAYAALGELPDPLRAAIVAVDVAGLSYKQAARSLRTRRRTVMSRVCLARERIATALERS